MSATTPAQELEPCPRCDTVPRLYHDFHEVNGDRYWTVCECKTTWKLPLAEAIEASNRRPTRDARAAVPGVTRPMVEYRQEIREKREAELMANVFNECAKVAEHYAMTQRLHVGLRPDTMAFVIRDAIRARANRSALPKE